MCYMLLILLVFLFLFSSVKAGPGDGQRVASVTLLALRPRRGAPGFSCGAAAVSMRLCCAFSPGSPCFPVALPAGYSVWLFRCCCCCFVCLWWRGHALPWCLAVEAPRGRLISACSRCWRRSAFRWTWYWVPAWAPMWRACMPWATPPTRWHARPWRWTGTRGIRTR